MTDLSLGELGQSALSTEVLVAIAAVSETTAKNHRLNNGETALYWHLVHVVASHVEEDGDEPGD